MPASAVPKLRGRPKAYDRDAALKAMRQVFWAKGFAATSLDDMSAATGMNRPSLYNAFGDKTEAFRAVLKDYIDDARPLYVEAFRTPAPLRDSLMKVYETSIAIYHNPEAQGMGCFMIGAALTDVKRDPEVGEMILGALKDMEAGFIRRFEKAQEAGECGHQGPGAYRFVGPQYDFGPYAGWRKHRRDPTVPDPDGRRHGAVDCCK